MALKQLKVEQKGVARQQQVVAELNTLVNDIQRSEKTIADLKVELETVNAKHQGRRTTREDVDYLTDLLACAKKKLNWEKQMASLQKRTPVLLEEMSSLINDAQNPPSEEMRLEMMRALEGVKKAMDALQQVKVD
jgi:hypothetical protein